LIVAFAQVAKTFFAPEYHAILDNAAGLATGVGLALARDSKKTNAEKKVEAVFEATEKKAATGQK
jgi:hypothetical protein